MKKTIKKIVSKLFKIVLILFLASVLLVSWQLYRNGINFKFVTMIAEAALNPEGSNYKVSLEDVKFSFVHRAVPVALNVRGVTVFDKDNHKVASIDELTTYLSGIALLHGTFAPNEIILHKPRINMFVDKNGNVGVGFDENDKNDDLINDEQIVSSSSNNFDDVQKLHNILDFKEDTFGRYSYLVKMNIVDGSLFFKEAATKTFWFSPKINISLIRDDDGINLNGSMELRQKNRQTAYIELDASAEKHKLQAKAYITNFILPDRVADVILAETRVTMPLSGEASLLLDLDREKPVNSILLRLDNLEFSFSGDKGALVLPEPVFAKYDVKSFLIEGYAKNGLKDVKLTKITAKTETGASAWGDADIINLDKIVAADFSEKLIMDFKLNAKDITMEALKDYWPAALGTDTHEWVAENISAGIAESGTFNLVFTRNEQGDIEATKTDGTVNIKNATVRYIDTLPLITNASGHLNLTKDDVRIIIEDGDSLGLKLYFADLYFYDIWEPQEKAKMLLRIRGDLADALKLLDMPPFGFIKDLDLAFTQVKGQADTTVDLDFPLRKDLTVDKVKVDVKANVKAEMLGVAGYDLRNSDIDIDVDNKKMLLEGEGVLHDTKVDFSWKEIFTGKDSGTIFNSEMILDTQARKKMGMDIYPFDENGLDGLAKVNIVSKTDRNNNEEMTVSADLTEAVLKNDIIGLYKERKVPATVEAVVKKHKDKIVSLPKFSLKSGRRISIDGSADFDDKGDLSKVYLDDVKLQGTDLKAELGVKGEHLDILIKGKSFNAEKLLENLFKSNDKGTGASFDKPIKLSAKLDEIWLSEKGNMNNFNLDLSFDKKGTKQGLLTANSVTGQKIKVTMGKTTDDKTKIVLESDDLGSVLKAFDITSNIKGGVTRGYAYMDDDLNLDGKIIVKDFTLVKAETLSRILKIASLTGILSALQSEGLGFEVSVLPFTYTDGVLQVKNAVASGFSLGLTAEGYLKNENINMEGNIVPAYAFNSFLGKIPLLGGLFTSEDGGGLVSFKYYIEGKMQSPDIVVNPLSVLAPGVIRKIFDKNVLNEAMSEERESK